MRMNSFVRKYILIVSVAIFAVISAMFFFCKMPANAASAAVSLTGPEIVRPGDTVAVSFKISGTKILGVQGELSFDSSQLTYGSISKKIADPWYAELSDNKLLAIDTRLSSPIESEKELLTVNFTVKQVPAGTKITVSFRNLIASDGKADVEVGTASCTFTVAEPLSSDNSLAKLTVRNAALSPDFAADTTDYTAEVPYEVAMLELEATAAGKNAAVDIRNPELTPDGVTEVAITVTAENGNIRIYTIKVHRGKDPATERSGNNALRSLSVNGFTLSPVFQSGITAYTVSVPYETETVRPEAIPEDAGAQVKIEGAEKTLLPGEAHIIKIICIAEDGTEKVYTVTVTRAAAQETPENMDTPLPKEQSTFAAPWWQITLLIAAALLLGGAAGAGILHFVTKKRNS